MRQTKIKDGLEVHRIDSKHAFYYACIDANNVTRILMYSYDTPIFIVSNVGKYPDSKLHVILNKDAYNYSRTTSKQISQWITELHLFTSFGCWLPWNFRDVLSFDTDETPEFTFDYVDYDVVTESVLRNVVYAMSHARNVESLELYQVK